RLASHDPCRNGRQSHPPKRSPVNFKTDSKIDEIALQVSVRAKGRGSYISRYKDIRSHLTPDAHGLVEFDGHNFESVTAELQLGRKKRTVGIYGPGLDAGLIDVSEDVKRLPSGHPEYNSIAAQVDELMEEFHEGMKT
ncbi:hypothetical protein, partial [Mesorhizobium sp. M0019]|uniref:hypothetical protein n=1 Tax=Mesorhizobium sp. M0019 TaxID=2956845 RepID=UPI00333673E6